MQATQQQIEKVYKLSGSAQVREFGKLAKQDKRFNIDSDIPIKDQLESVLHPVVAELESDLAIDNDKSNEPTKHDSTTYLELATFLIEGKRTHTTSDTVTVESALDDNEPVGTGLAGSNGELFYWPLTNDYACKPYNSLTAIPSSVWELVNANFQPLSNVKKQAIAKAVKAVEVKPIKQYAQFVITYSFESVTDLNGKTFANLTELEEELKLLGIEYECSKQEQITIKRLHSQRAGSTGTTKGGLSDPFERPDPSQPVSADMIKAVKRGSNTHLALLALVNGINIKDKSESAIARLNELAKDNNCETIDPSQFSWKFRQAALLNGYGYKLLSANTYQLVLPAGLDTIKVK